MLLHLFNIILPFVSIQEKVRSVEGSREFLQALGFISVMLPVEGQGKGSLITIHQIK